MRVYRIAWLTALLQCFVAPVNAHEFWIEPREYVLTADQKLLASMKVGETFEGSESAYSKSRVVWRRLANSAGLHEVPGNNGDKPAFNISALLPGLNILALQTFPSSLRYTDWENFESFVNKEGLEWVPDAHRRRDLPDTGFVEIYSRFSKALVQVGDNPGQDREIGLDFEWVALTNPYAADPPEAVNLQLSLRGIPKENVLVSVFNKLADQSKSQSRTVMRTDKNGMVTIPRQSGGSFLVSAIHMEPIDPEQHNGVLQIDTKGPGAGEQPNPTKSVQGRVLPEGTVWHSLWASITFQIPAQ